MRKALLLALPLAALAATARALEYTPLYNISLLGGQYFFAGDRTKLNGNGHGPVSWNNALAEGLPFRTATVDAVVCANSFHYYRHPISVLMEFHRVLKPEGFFVLADWCHDFLTCKVGQWALRVAHQTGIHRYGLERCYGMEDFTRLLTSAGFQIEMSRSFEIDWGWGAMVYRARA